MDRKLNTFYILAGIFAIIYFTFVWLFADNIPYWDDYVAEQNFLVKYLQSSTLSEKVSLSIEQHNEHRLLFTRLVTLVVYFFTGKLNYLFYICLSNIMLFSIGILIYRMVKENMKKAISAFLITLLLCNGQHLETSLWAMSGLANIGILFLAFVSLYCMISENQKLNTAGFLLSVLTIFSNGNGMFITLPAFICLVLQRRRKTYITYAIIVSISIILYFFNYVKPARTDIHIVELIRNIPQILINLCTFVGLNFWIPSFKMISILIGVFCLSVYLWGIWKKWYQTNMFCYACLTFLYFNAGAVAILWLTNGVAGALRYRIYSSLILTLTVILLLVNHNNKFLSFKKYIYLLTSFVLVFNLSSVIYVQKEIKRSDFKKKSVYNWHNKGKRLATWSDSSSEKAIPYLKQAEHMGLYKMPQYPLSKYVASIKEKAVGSTMQVYKMPYQIENISQRDGYLLIEGWVYLKDKSMNFSNIYICLFNQEKQYILTSLAERRYDLKINIPLDRIEHCGFFTVVDRREIKTGNYQIGILIKRLFDRDKYCILTKETITI